MDRRWQLVLDTLATPDAPFSQGGLVAFRERLIAHELDRALLDRTVEVAKRTGQVGWQRLRAVFDSSPLIGAGRVEDPWNRLGRALRAVVSCAAQAVAQQRARVIAEAGLTLLDQPSLKAALDIDWADPAAQAAALARLLEEVEPLDQWVCAQLPAVQATPALQTALTAPPAVMPQDLEPDPTTGRPRIRQGVARGRQPSLGDPDAPQPHESQPALQRRQTARGQTGRRRPDCRGHHPARQRAGACGRADARRPSRPTARSGTCGSSAAIWPVRRLRHFTRPGWRSTPNRGRPATATGFPSRPSPFAGRTASSNARPSRGFPMRQSTVHFAAATCGACALRATGTTAAAGALDQPPSA